MRPRWTCCASSWTVWTASRSCCWSRGVRPPGRMCSRARRPRSQAVQVPRTIHGLLLGRIDRLPPPVRQVLREAAVIGPLFAEALLQDIGTARGMALDEALLALIEAGLLAPEPASPGAAGA